MTLKKGHANVTRCHSLKKTVENSVAFYFKCHKIYIFIEVRKVFVDNIPMRQEDLSEDRSIKSRAFEREKEVLKVSK